VFISNRFNLDISHILWSSRLQQLRCTSVKKSPATTLTPPIQVGKLHCSVVHGLPNGYTVAVSYGSPELQRTPHNLERIHCIRLEPFARTGVRHLKSSVARKLVRVGCTYGSGVHMDRVCIWVGCAYGFFHNGAAMRMQNNLGMEEMFDIQYYTHESIISAYPPSFSATCHP
jgi:hypothetical protein